MNGLIVPPRDSAAIARAIISLQQDPQICQQIAQNARDTIQKRFNVETSVTKTAELYHQLVEESASEQHSNSRSA